jgi:hypothetical protein
MKLASPKRSPTGLTLWPMLPEEAQGGTPMSIVWPGPGSGLYLGIRATEPGGSMVRIEHRTADGQYDTFKQAQKAAHAFAAADA